jgi:hypothetical protein
LKEHPPNPEDQEQNRNDGQEDGKLLHSWLGPKGLIFELCVF